MVTSFNSAGSEVFEMLNCSARHKKLKLYTTTVPIVMTLFIKKVRREISFSISPPFRRKGIVKLPD